MPAITPEKYHAKGVDWFRFVRDPDSHETELYHENLRVGWVINLMMYVVDRLHAGTRYVGGFVLEHNRLTSIPPYTSFRKHSGRAYDYTKNSKFMYQLTFVHGEVERVCVLYICKGSAQDHLYIFFPFPDYLKEIQAAIDWVVQKITAEWMQLHQKKLISHQPVDFSPGFVSSNIFAVYFLVLVQKYPYEEVERLLGRSDMHLLAKHKASMVYRQLGQVISSCIHSQKDAAKYLEYAEYMGAEAEKSLVMNSTKFEFLWKCLGQCKIPKEMMQMNLMPNAPPEGYSVERELLSHEPSLANRMRNFLPREPGAVVGEMKLFV